MKKIRQFFEQLFPNNWVVITSIPIGFSISLFIYLSFLQRHFFSWTYLAYALLMAVAGILLVGWLNSHFIFRFFSETSKPARNIAILFSFTFILMLLFNTEIHPLYYILPDTDLKIQFTIPTQPEGEEGVKLLWIKTGQGYVHYTNMKIDGNWERVSNNTIFSPGQSVAISWTGKVGSYVEIAFGQTNFDQKVNISLNEESKTFNLKDPNKPNIKIRLKNNIPAIYYLPFVTSFIVAMGYLIFTILVTFPKFKQNKKVKEIKNQPKWLFYALPMIAVWTFSLLIFWPGVITNDSFDLWGQAVTGRFNDWQSAFYSISLFLLLKIIKSPAFILLIQIVVSAVIVAWGLKIFRDFGVPKAVLWLISFFFAFSPTNNMLLITLWKDVPYAFAFLLFTILLIRIFLSDGKWINNTRNWILLGVIAFLIAIFRQNGIPVVLATLALLPFVYKQYGKQFFGSLLMMAALFLLMKGPVYSAFNTDKSGSGQVNVLFMHHIAAHLSAGSDFAQDELNYLNGLLPINKWDYSCCYAGNVYFESGFNQKALLTNTEINVNIFINQFKQDPLVDLKHILCSGEMAWKFNNTQCYMKSTHGFYSWHTDRIGWIGENDFGLTQSSFFPGLINPYALILRNFGFLDDNLVFYLKPAFYFYFLLLFLYIYYRNTHNLKMLIIGAPVIFQTALLFLINFAPVFRYFFSTYLVGLFLFGLIFLPSGNPKE